MVFSCKKEQEKIFPEIVASTLNVTEDGAILTSTVRIGSEGIIDHGVIINSTSQSYKISLGAFPGGTSFSVNIDRNLVKGWSYTAKAYLQTESHLMTYGNSVSFVSNSPESPEVIKDYFPKTAFIADTITIYGNHFSSYQNNIEIWFGQVKTKPCVVNDTLLKVVIPELSVTADLPIGVELGSKMSTAKELFNLKLPIISEITPTKVVPSEPVKISGKGFLGVSKIIVDDSDQNIIARTDSTLTFSITGNISKGEKLIQLFQIDRHIPLNEKLEVLYPEITGVSPITVWNDTILTVSGTNLDFLNSFSMNNATFEIVSTTASLVKLKVLEITGNGYLSAQANFNNATTITSSQEVLLNPPVITSVSGTAIYGETIMLHGDRFFSGIECSLGDFQYINKNEAKLTINMNLEPGTYPISLSYIYGHLVNTFSVTIPKFEVIDISPYEIKCGTKVTINTKNFPQINPVDCYLDDQRIYFQNDNGVLTATMPEDYIDCNEYPILTINVGYRISIPDKFHVTQEWTRIKCPVNSFQGKARFIENEGSLYYLTTNNRSTSEFYSFNPNTEKWILFDDNQAVFSEYSTHFCIGQDIYFLIPNYLDSYTELYRYSLSNLTLKKMNQPPFDYFNYNFTINGKVYLGNYESLYMYNPENDTWTPKKKPPILSDYGCYFSSFSTDTKGYLGFVCEGTYNSLHEYDPNKDSWKDTGQLINYDIFNAACFRNGKIYFWGDKFGEFNPVTYEIRQMKKPPVYESPIIFFSGNFVYLVSSRYDPWGYDLHMFKIAIADLPKIYK